MENKKENKKRTWAFCCALYEKYSLIYPNIHICIYVVGIKINFGSLYRAILHEDLSQKTKREKKPKNHRETNEKQQQRIQKTKNLCRNSEKPSNTKTCERKTTNKQKREHHFIPPK